MLFNSGDQMRTGVLSNANSKNKTKALLPRVFDILRFGNKSIKINDY